MKRSSYGNTVRLSAIRNDIFRIICIAGNSDDD